MKTLYPTSLIILLYVLVALLLPCSNSQTTILEQGPNAPHEVVAPETRSKEQETIPKFERTTTEAIQEFANAIRTKQALTPEKRVTTCISFLKRELLKPSQPGWGSNGGPIDTGYALEVIMGSVCTFAERGQVREAISTRLKAEISAVPKGTRLYECMQIMLGYCGNHEMIPGLVHIASTHAEGYMRSSAALALSNYLEIKAIPDFRNELPTLKTIMHTDTYARIRTPHRRNGKQWEVYSPVRESIAIVLRDLGEQTETSLVETSYGIERTEQLLYLGNDLTREKTVEIMYALDQNKAEEALIRYLTKQQSIADDAFTADLDIRLEKRLLANNDMMSTAVEEWLASETRKQLLQRIQAQKR